jgi:hypothetical protein
VRLLGIEEAGMDPAADGEIQGLKNDTSNWERGKSEAST